MVKGPLTSDFIRPVSMLTRWRVYVQQDGAHLMYFVMPIVTFLFIIWLVYRIENRAAKDAIYKNFPLFKDAVDSFQLKIDYLISRVNSLEERIIRIEGRLK